MSEDKRDAITEPLRVLHPDPVEMGQLAAIGHGWVRIVDYA